MSYLVTARKWRPEFFNEVISQKHVTDTLQNAIGAKRIGHAYLFCGPRGVGKTTIARIFSKAINCEKGPAEEPCNECGNCLGIKKGNSLDVQELDGASNNSVEDARELITKVGYHASRSRYKIYIIDEVHMLSKAAFNALLKTIEEPPPNVIFIFATTEPHKIPATILSRCQRFDFHRLTPEDIAGKLAKIAETDSISIDSDSLLLIAQRAGGAMRDAESILEQLKSSKGGTVSPKDVVEMLGMADRETFFSIIECCHRRDTAGVLGLFKGYYDGGGDLKEFVEGLLSHLRDMLYSHIEGGLDRVILPTGMKSRLAEQSEWYSQGDVIRMIGYATDVETSLAYSLLPTLRIEVMLVRLASLEKTVQIKDILGKLEKSLHEKSSPAQGGTAPAEEHKTADSGESIAREPVTIEGIKRDWDDIVDTVTREKPDVGPSLGYGKPKSLARGKLVVGFPKGGDYHCKKASSDSKAVADIICRITGEKITVGCVMNHADRKEKSGAKQEIDDLVAREPIIGDILDSFDGEINGTWRE